MNIVIEKTYLFPEWLEPADVGPFIIATAINCNHSVLEYAPDGVGSLCRLAQLGSLLSLVPKLDNQNFIATLIFVRDSLPVLLDI
eukprot:1103605-Ditylum_brightwellii.AAC.1